jgi:hypothetical protein
MITSRGNGKTLLVRKFTKPNVVIATINNLPRKKKKLIKKLFADILSPEYLTKSLK